MEIKTDILEESISLIKKKMFKGIQHSRLKKPYKFVYLLSSKNILMHYVVIKEKKSELPASIRALITKVVNNAVNQYRIKEDQE